mmetsp:Transcript_23225/g.54998  ORF Transcript_23225/g.54998 Transcript_23225/m.54998 type:complete len:289 (-) Transcript_23225:827-1693(-)
MQQRGQGRRKACPRAAADDTHRLWQVGQAASHQLGPAGVGGLAGVDADQVQVDAARAAGQSRARREPRGTLHAGCPADDQHLPMAALVAGRAAIWPGHRSEQVSSRGLVGCDAEVVEPDLPAIHAAFAGEQAGLERQQRQRVVGAQRELAGGLARVGQQAAGQIHGKQGRTAGLHRVDGGQQLEGGRAVQAQAQQRVDHEGRALGGLKPDMNRETLGREKARCDAAIAAVVARTADHPDRPVVTAQRERQFRHRQAGALHQVGRVGECAGLDASAGSDVEQRPGGGRG